MLDEIRDAVKLCRNTDNVGCTRLTKYRDQADVKGASHPVLFQVVPDARIMIIGAIPGSIDSRPSKAAYQRLVNGQFSLGHSSAKGLGEIMMRVGKIKDIKLPADITILPNKESIQENHLLARQRLGLHVTNLVKCYAPSSWEKTHNETWGLSADACLRRHLLHEMDIIDPSMVILLGTQVAEHFSDAESWGVKRRNLKISAWAEKADYLPICGKDRFVTAWPHPGQGYFWIKSQGQTYWNLYASQIAEFVH